MKKILLVICTFLLTLSAEGVEKEITLTAPGTITELYNSTEAYNWTSLTIKGPMNDADFANISSAITTWAKTSLTTIDMSGVTGLTKIAAGGFAQMNVLAQVKLPSQIREIGAGAFYGDTRLLDANLPDSLRSIGYEAFYNCNSLIRLNLPKKLEKIGKATFIGCSTIEGTLKIPANVTEIGEGAFAMMGIDEISLDKKNTNFTVEDGILYSKDQKTLLQVPGKIEDGITINDKVTKFGAFCAAGCSEITSINIPSGVTEIGQGAFMNSSKISRFSFPATLTKIGELAFSGLSSIKDITVAKGNTVYSSVDGVLFGNAGKTLMLYPALKESTQFTVPEGTDTINENAFMSQKYLKKISLPSSLKVIGDNAFETCTKLEAITIPENVDSIGSQAFAFDSALVRVDIKAPIKKIENLMFYACTSLKYINLPSSLQAIKTGAFAYTGFETFALPEGTQTIGMLAFSYMPNLKKFYINSGLTYFGDAMLYNCIFNESKNITDVYCLKTAPPTSGTDWSLNITDEGKMSYDNLSNATLHVPAGSKNSFKDTSWEDAFGDIVADAKTTDYLDALIAQRENAVEESTTDGIRSAKTANDANAIPVGIFTINGKKINSVQKGLNIIKMSDGSVRKVLVNK